jgi:hypothetical protein
VTLANGTIQKFAFYGTVAGQNWTIEDNEIHYSHSRGLRAFNRGTVRGNQIHHNGDMEIFAKSGTFTFEGNELAFNNYLNFGMKTEAWHSGAIRNNTFRWNRGLWVNSSKDLDVSGNLFDRNGGYSIGFVAEKRGVSDAGPHL